MSYHQKTEKYKVISQRDWPYIFILLGIGFLTRIILFSQIYLISLDGAFQYIPVAKLFAWGEYGKALNQPQLPLYPFLMAILSRVIGDFEVSGQIISITTSILAVIPLFLLGKSLFGQNAAFWAGIFYLLNPEMLQCSVDVLKEGLLIFFLLSAVFLFYIFLNRKKIFWLVASILVTLLAVLTRVVSLIFIPVFIFWILSLKKKSFNMGFIKRLGNILIILALCTVVVMPLMVNVKSITGRWDISKKGITVHSLIESIFFDKQAEMGEGERGLFPLIRKIIKVYHPILFLFLLAGLIRRKVIPRDFLGEIFLFSFIFSHLVIIGLMMWSTQRYLFFPILLSYLWAGVGVVEIQEKVMGNLHLSQQKLTLGLSILIFLVFLPIFVKPYRVEKLGTKQIGFWIKNQEIGKPLILTDVHRVAYYAGGDLLVMDKLNYRKSVFEAKEKGVKYIVVKEKNMKEYSPDLIELVKKDFFEQDVPFLQAKEQEKYLVFKSRY
jgi:4-amino-4-deoxy-L-arabinose transferase-like glycosyltransferase